MKSKTEDINVKGINSEIKRKSMFVLKCKGTDLSKEIKKVLEENAKEFEKYIKE